MRLEIRCEDRMGMVREVLELFIPHNIDMRLIEADSKRHCVYCGFSDIPFVQLQVLLADIRRLDGVEDVKTVMFTPMEREHNALHMLLEALPDGVMSVDVKGNITMATELASEDLGVPLQDLLHRPLQHFIKSVSFSKIIWTDMKGSYSKRIRLRKKTLLLEMKPIFVPDEHGEMNSAGAVIHLKSETRLNRQTEKLRRVSNVETNLENHFLPEVAKSHAMQKCLEQAKVLALMSEPLLILGELGTGKQDIAQFLFQYWYEQHANKESRFVLCHGREMTIENIEQLEQFSGWLVIDGIEHLKEKVQVALVKWLEKPLHSSNDFSTAVRIIGLSSVPERELCCAKYVHASLYFSLSALRLFVPPLRDRIEDIPGLIHQILASLSERTKLPIPFLSSEALTKMCLYHWPGNLKELQNICLQTLSLVKERTWDAEDVRLPGESQMASLVLRDGSLDKTVKEWEAQLLSALYPKFPSTRKLAKAVGMSHSAVANKLREYGITNK